MSEWWYEYMGLLYLGQDLVWIYGMAVFRSGYKCEGMGRLYVGQE
jgi:hypothetical protein